METKIVTVHTESGSVYKFNSEDLTMLRVTTEPERVLRKDEEWIQMLQYPVIEEGFSMYIALAPLGEGDVTMRYTTPVTLIEEND